MHVRRRARRVRGEEHARSPAVAAGRAAVATRAPATRAERRRHEQGEGERQCRPPPLRRRSSCRPRLSASRSSPTWRMGGRAWLVRASGGLRLGRLLRRRRLRRLGRGGRGVAVVRGRRRRRRGRRRAVRCRSRRRRSRRGRRGRCVAQLGRVIVSVSSVTAPFRARTRPSTVAPVVTRDARSGR